MNDKIKNFLAIEKAIMGYNLVEVRNCITTDDFDTMKERLEGFGYKYFIGERKAYARLEDIGKSSSSFVDAVEIKHKNGVYKATVITYTRRY